MYSAGFLLEGNFFQDDQQAAAWYRKAAEHGLPSAQSKLAAMQTRVPKVGHPAAAKVVPTANDERASRDLCEARIKSGARHPSTVDIHWFTGYATKTLENGTRIVWQDFTAKNDYGLELTYTALCEISPNGNLEISISERQ